MSNLKSVYLTVFELLAFTPTGPLRTHRHTDRQAHIERTHYLRHSLRSLGGDKQESPAVADKPARRLRKVRTVYVRAVGL